MKIKRTQRQKDVEVLLLWASKQSLHPRHGYERVAQWKGYSVERAKRRLVHPAIERTGGNPHSSAGLIRAWVYWHREAGKVDVIW